MAQSRSSLKKSTKLGRNPFEKSPLKTPGNLQAPKVSQSRVGRIIEASFDQAGEVPVPAQQRGLFDRLQEMQVSLDVRQLVKTLLDLRQ